MAKFLEILEISELILAPPKSLNFFAKHAQNLKYLKHGDIIIPGYCFNVD